MNTTIIVQRFFEYTLEFPKYERFLRWFLRGAEGLILNILSCIPQNKPRIMLLIQLVVIVFKHSVKGLDFPKCERLKEKHLEKDNLSCILLKNLE